MKPNVGPKRSQDLIEEGAISNLALVCFRYNFTTYLSPSVFRYNLIQPPNSTDEVIKMQTYIYV